MSRKTLPFTENVEVIYGNDHAIGSFIDITDKRYARSGKDEQGEGYVMEWSQVFGFTNNLIGATVEDLKSRDKMVELADKFALTLDHGRKD